MAITLPSSLTKTNTKQESKEKNSLWINVGIPVTINGVLEYINLPLGIPLDQVKELKTDTNNRELNQLNQARNKLLQTVLNDGLKQEPGSTYELEMTVTIHRIKEAEVINEEENPYLLALSK